MAYTLIAFYSIFQVPTSPIKRNAAPISDLWIANVPFSAAIKNGWPQNSTGGVTAARQVFGYQSPRRPERKRTLESFYCYESRRMVVPAFQSWKCSSVWIRAIGVMQSLLQPFLEIWDCPESETMATKFEPIISVVDLPVSFQVKYLGIVLGMIIFTLSFVLGVIS